MEHRQRTRGPPVGAAEESHHRGHDQDPDDRGVDCDRDGEADADGFDDHDVGIAEGEEHGDHDQGGSGDEAAALLQARRHAGLVVARPAVLLLNPADQKHLVVHRHAEDDAEEDDRDAGIDRLRREVEQAAQMALLKHPHHRAERGRDREQVGEHGLQGQHHRAGEQEQDDICDQDHRCHRDRRPLQDEVHDVEVERGFARGEHLPVRNLRSPHRFHDRARVVARVLLVGGDGEDRQVRPGTCCQGLLHRRRQIRGRSRVQTLIVRPAEAGAEVDDARNAEHIRHRGELPAQVVNRADVVGRDRTAVRVVDDGGDRGLVLPGKVPDESVQPSLVCLGAGHSPRQALQEPRPRNQQKCQSRDQHDDRPTHYPHRHSVPNARTGRRASSQEGQPLLQPGRPPVHARSEHREDGGQEGEAIKDCDRDHDRARGAHRSEERALEKQHRRKPDRDGDPRERDRAAGG